MLLTMIFDFLSNNLTGIMAAGVVLALCFRYLAYRSGRVNQFYFTSFARNVEKHIENERKNGAITNVEDWLDDLLDKVMLDMPERNLRLTKKQQDVVSQPTSGMLRRETVESIEEFAYGKKSIFHSIKQHVDTFKSAHPPNYQEFASRVMSKDREWSTILKVVPIELVTRVLDILPGLFVVGGIFGTFIGIVNALPKIATLDLSNLDAAAIVMSSFVADIAYSMNTSIVGIICSVVMTLLNTVFPIASFHLNVMKNVEQCLESIWVRVHGDKIELADARIIELLEKIHEKLGGSSNNHNQKAS